MKTVKTIIAMIGMTLVLFASDQRIAALGGNVGFWPDDDQSYTMFPTAINDLDFIQVSGAGTGNGSVGIVWGEETTYGFMFSGDDASNNDMINLAWGNGTLGALIGVGMSSNKVGDGNESSTMDFNASVGTNMDFGEVGGHFAYGTVSDGDDSTEDQNVMGFGAALRREQNVWLFSHMLTTFDYLDLSAGDALSAGGMGLAVDMFTSIDVSEDVNAVFALGFGYETSDMSMQLNDTTTINSESTIMSLPAATVAVEANVTDWAAVRFGMNHSYVLSGSSTDDAVETTWSGTTDHDGESNFGWNFGLGFDYGSFTLDMVVEETLFTNPVHYVTGRNTEALTTSASITWNF